MAFGRNFLLVTAMLSVISATAGSSHTAADQSLTRYIVKSKFSNDPQVSVRCFGYYIPILINVSYKLSKAFQNCTDTENIRIGMLNDAAVKDRYQTEQAAGSVSARLNACNQQPNAIDFFDCHSAHGNDNSNILFTVTQNSAEKSADLRELYRIVEVDKYKCQNASERIYIEHTAQTYKDLDICLQTGVMSSTMSPTNSTAESRLTAKKEGKTTSGSGTTGSGLEERTTGYTTTEEPVREVLTEPSVMTLSKLRRLWGSYQY